MSSVFFGWPKYMPPVNSRTTRMSMPSPCRSFASGHACESTFGNFTGRRLANRPNSLRNRSSAARSGRSSLGIVGSRSGRPTEPNRMESLFLHNASVASGRAFPAASMPAQPTGASVRLRVKPNFSPVTRRTLMASRMTSGPMPSPASAAMLNDFMNSSGQFIFLARSDNGILIRHSKFEIQNSCHGFALQNRHAALLLQRGG